LKKPPEEVEPWNDTWDAGDFGPTCIAFKHILDPQQNRDPIGGQEDCLYLNIFTPQLPTDITIDSDLMDVIIYIHGGAFMFGSGIFYGAKYLADRQVVLVTINYRLGPFGFLSFEDDELPGNNGLRDQLLALKWVNKHISKFGGNPKSVTLMGLSAGGASVHFMYLSPITKGKF
jgi:bile salt-stimulated lipase